MTSISDLKNAIVNKCNNLISSHNSNNNAHNTLFSNKINVSDVVDDLITSDGSKPLSAKQGKILKELLDSVMYNVSLTSDKTRISALDSEYVLLTATVTNPQSAPLQHIRVYFYKENTLIGTSRTDSLGKATMRYNGEGDGRINITAEVETVSSNNITIDDYYLYDDLTADKQRYTLTSGSGTFVFSDNGLKVTGTASSDTFWYAPDNFLPANDYTVEVDYMDWGNLDAFGSDFGIEDIFIGIQPSLNRLAVYKKNGSIVTQLTNFNFVKGKTFKFEVTGTNSKTIAIYYDNTLICTASNITQTRKQFFKTYNNRMTEFKNLKILKI